MSRTAGPILTTAQQQELEGILERILGDYPINPDVAKHVMANFAADVDRWADRDDPLTIVYTGSRLADRAKVRADLSGLYDRFGGFRILIGYDRDKDRPSGGDRYAYEWAAAVPDVTVELHPAPWHIPELARAAGPARNGYTVGLVQGRGGRHGMLAHLFDGSTGSAGAAAFARHVGVAVWRRPA
ncbi:hypothetical protein [Nonomuraea sp. NPDC049758]|uniref:hypothetical protein n=1 Tax=Nonomuraea sp. NPDC049758 TaxID=3154360 RepID=UPI00342B2835